MPAYLIQIIYFVGVLLLLIGFKKISSPSSSKSGLIVSGIGLLIAVLITFFNHQVSSHYLLMTIALLLGAVIAFVSTRSTTLTDTPKMVSLFNVMGSGAAATIATLLIVKLEPMSDIAKYLVVLGALLGSISFSASIVIFFRLKGLLKSGNRFPMQQWLNALILVIAITFGIAIVLNGNHFEMASLLVFLFLALLFGALMTLPIEDIDLPVGISLFNALTGFAVSFLGYVLSNPVMIIGGALAGTAALVLTGKISKSMNRSIPTILFGSDNDSEFEDTINNINKNIKELEADDAATMMAFSKNVIIVPGYGMATAQAQSELLNVSNQLEENGVNVKFAVHPVAGRMPGHMNLLLAEAGIDNDSIFDLNEINDQFERADVVLIIGANDVTNPSARTEQSSPIFDMPILNADMAKNVIVVKRGNGTGFSKIDNPLFYQDNTRLIFGDAKSVLRNLARILKTI